MASRPWMPLYIGDYRRDTAHLSTLEHGAYMLLIMHYWETGPLPVDRVRLARIAGLTVKRFNPVWVSLRGFFTEANAEQLPSKCFRHKRIDQERENAERVSFQRSLAGFKGGKASRGKNNLGRYVGKAIAKQTGTQSQSHSPACLTSEPAAPPQEASGEGSKGGLKASPYLDRVVSKWG